MQFTIYDPEFIILYEQLKSKELNDLLELEVNKFGFLSSNDMIESASKNRKKNG